MTVPSSFAAQFSEMGKAMLVAGLALLAASAILLVSAEHDLRKNNAEVQRSNAALLQLAEINSLVIGVDYSARGYALTGEQLFLDHENEKQQGLKLGLADLIRLADPEQADDIAQLTRLIDRHAAVYAQFVKMGPGHAKEMAALITNPVERQKRYDVLAALQSLHEKLMANLLSHQALAEKQQRFTLILTFMIVAIAFLGGIMDVVVKTVLSRRRRHSGNAAITPN
jgi:CHASE3 domain sensor protein